MLIKSSPYSLVTKLLTLVLVTTGCAEHFVPDPSLPPIPPAPPEDEGTGESPDDPTSSPPTPLENEESVKYPDSKSISSLPVDQNPTPEPIPPTRLNLPPNSQEYRIRLKQRVVSENRKWIASSPQGTLYKISGLPDFDQLKPETEYIIYATFHGTTTWNGQNVYILRAVE